MPLLLIGVFAIGAVLMYSKSTGTSSSLLTFDINNLPDIDPSQQSGGFDTTYDSFFQASSQEFGVPFALMKAHSIRESALVSSAFRQEPSGKASYGLMQVLWWKGSNRFAKYGYSDDTIADGTPLYDCTINTRISAQLIKSNLSGFGNLRDAINAYNTGVRESKRVAPGNYVGDVLNYYSKITGKVLS